LEGHTETQTARCLATIGGYTDTQAARRSHKPKKLEEDKQTRRQQGDLISIVTKIKGDAQADGQTRKDAQKDRQQRDFIRLLSFFKRRKLG
jgi:hypothetical protein